MSGLRAALYKDFKLFFSGMGLLALLLPILLVPALRLGMGDLSGQSYVRPFPIAVRDMDNTLMSRSLLSQIEAVQLFSRVDRLGEDEPDSAALAAGAAAVVTVPKDFFYDLYRMEDCPVEVTLNTGMELESGLFQAVFSSVMGIIRANQTASLGAYTLACGELTPGLQNEMYAQSARQLIADALGRQLVFDTASEASDLAGALERRLLACILGVLALFFVLSAVKTLPEEMALGVLPRFQAMGRGAASFWASKFLTALLLSLPTVLLCAAVFRDVPPLLLLLLYILLLFAAFGILSALAAWTANAQAAQRWGNLLLLLSLALGGTLWPRSALPAPLPLLGKLTLPYYAALGLEADASGMGWGTVLALLWPLPVMGAVGLALAAVGLSRFTCSRRAASLRHGQNPASLRGPWAFALAPLHPRCSRRLRASFFRRRSGRGADASTAPGAPVRQPRQDPPLTGLLRRLVSLSRFKLWAMAGGLRGIAAALAVCLLCGAAAASVRDGTVGTLQLLLCDLDGSALSRELAERIAAAEGVSVTLCGEDEGRRVLLDGGAEGMLVIGKGYAAALQADGTLPLHYEGGLSARSAQGTRELIAGMVSAQRSRQRAVLLSAELLGRPITDGERLALGEIISGYEKAMPPLFHIGRSSGAGLDGLFVPGQMSFAALAGLFTCLTAASWCGSRDSRLALRRMSAIPRGVWLAYGSDCLALAALGLLSLLAVLLPGGEVPLPAAALYALCAAALSLALTRLAALEGRVDALAPFLALLLCLLGGCFIDLSRLSPRTELLAMIAPPGLAARAAQGVWPAYGILGAETAACFALGFPRRGK